MEKPATLVSFCGKEMKEKYKKYCECWPHWRLREGK